MCDAPGLKFGAVLVENSENLASNDVMPWGPNLEPLLKMLSQCTYCLSLIFCPSPDVATCIMGFTKLKTIIFL